MVGNYLKQVLVLMIVLGLFYVGVSFVFGVQGATTITAGTSSRAGYTNTSSQSLQVNAGNVTQVDISGQSVTTHWAGFFGNISGNVTLKDSSGNTFYDWSSMGVPTGEVFASNSSAVGWAGIGCINSTEITNLESSLGINSSDPDRINTTYATSGPSFTVASVALSACNSTNAYTNTGKAATTYYQVLLTDTTGNPVYTALINDSTTSFNSATADFELLVGESDNGGTTQMYFYIELD